MDTYFVIPAKALLELDDESYGKELPSLRKLGVDDGHQCSVDVGEGGGGSLGLDHRPNQKTSGRQRENLSQLLSQQTDRI